MQWSFMKNPVSFPLPKWISAHCFLASGGTTALVLFDLSKYLNFLSSSLDLLIFSTDFLPRIQELAEPVSKITFIGYGGVPSYKATT